MTPNPLPRMSLFQISSDLRGLIEQRTDAEERREQSAIDGLFPLESIEQEIATIDGLIRQYIRAEIRKVDGIAAAIKEFDARAEIHLKESDRLRKLAEQEQETSDRIRETAIAVMTELGETKMRGEMSALRVQNNGGVQPLNIAQPDMVPEKYQVVTFELRSDMFEYFCTQFEGAYKIKQHLHPDNGAVRKVLEAAQRSEAAIEILAETEKWTPEEKQQAMSKVERVPGCRLDPRGVHLRIT